LPSANAPYVPVFRDCCSRPIGGHSTKEIRFHNIPTATKKFSAVDYLKYIISVKHNYLFVAIYAYSDIFRLVRSHH